MPILRQFVSNSPIENKPVLGQLMGWCPTEASHILSHVGLVHHRVYLSPVRRGLDLYPCISSGLFKKTCHAIRRGINYVWSVFVVWSSEINDAIAWKRLADSLSKFFNDTCPCVSVSVWPYVVFELCFLFVYILSTYFRRFWHFLTHYWYLEYFVLRDNTSFNGAYFYDKPFQTIYVIC